MTLANWIVFNDYYKGLRANGWPKQAAAEAARRHLNRLKPRQLKAELERIGPAPQ
jgi:hypothetical protein